jgi:hypothetical protein
MTQTLIKMCRGATDEWGGKIETLGRMYKRHMAILRVRAEIGALGISFCGGEDGNRRTEHIALWWSGRKG